jgi:hypothetical protein
MNYTLLSPYLTHILFQKISIALFVLNSFLSKYITELIVLTYSHHVLP